ncbi:MAG TPA: DNA translocase FtsK 4TM domain-containing protein [Clostridia bacterium]|nr:DNA translocase FtsK 4TM domain-containing protein [Clostridia bacterium]
MAQKKRTSVTHQATEKSKNQPQSSVLAKEILGIVIIALGLLAFICIFFTSNSGTFGKPFKQISSGLFGWAHYLIPLAILLFGCYIALAGRVKQLSRKTMYLILLILLIPCFFQIAYLSKNMSQISSGINVWQFISHMYSIGISEINNGGVFGGILMTPFVIFFGVTGGYIITITATVVLVIYITNKSFLDFLIKIKNMFVAFIKWMKDAFKPIEDGQEEPVSKELKKQPYIQNKIDDITIEPVKETINKEPVNIIINKSRPIQEEPKKPVSRYTGPIIIKKEEPLKSASPAITEKPQEKGEYVFPPLSLLDSYVDSGNSDNYEQIARKLENTLLSFGVEVSVTNIMCGPTVTRYELQPKSGVKVSRIVALADDISLNLASRDVRIEAPVPGKSVVGIEVPNTKKSVVSLKEVIASKEFQGSKSILTIAIGKDIAGNCTIADVRRMPHMLIAGATGSGKSVCINCIITSILYKATPDDVRFIMIDPKKVELINYNGIPHLLIPVITNLKKAAGALNWAVEEMTNRYDMFNKRGVRDINSYNDSVKNDPELKKMPNIVILIDELADLMMTNPGEVEESICRLAQLARAAGIHLIIATQRPSVNVITGVIKANIPSRLSFAVVSQVDSRTILDMGGAEKLLGNGDMLFHPMGLSKPVRMQGAYISDSEINKVVEFIKQRSNSSYDEDVVDNIEKSDKKASDNDVENEIDELLPAAIDLVVEIGQASVSYLQRKLKLGYGRAARIVDQMELRGIVGPFEGSKPRAVLISREEWAEMQMNNPDLDVNNSR